MHAIVGSVLAILAGAVCVGAGVYLLSFHPSISLAPDIAAADQVFAAVQNGLGVYAIGQGVAVWGFALMLGRRGQ